MFVKVSSDSSFPVNEGDGGVVAAPVLPRREREEVDIMVVDVHAGGVESGELEGTTVIREVAIRLVAGGVLSDRDGVVRRRLGGLLNVRLERHRHGGRGPGREQRWGRRMRKLDWCVEEGGKRPGGREPPGLSPAVMAINLLLSSNGDRLDYLRDHVFTGPDSVPSEVTRAWNQEDR